MGSKTFTLTARGMEVYKGGPPSRCKRHTPQHFTPSFLQILPTTTNTFLNTNSLISTYDTNNKTMSETTKEMTRPKPDATPNSTELTMPKPPKVKQPPKPSTLLNVVPREIRDQIWGYALSSEMNNGVRMLKDPKAEVVEDHSRKNRHQRKYEKKLAQENVKTSKKTRQTASRFSLLLTSKQIYFEASEVWYKQNYFLFPSPHDFEWFLRRSCLNSNWKQHLTKIVLGVDCLFLLPPEDVPPQVTAFEHAEFAHIGAENKVNEILRHWRRVFSNWGSYGLSKLKIVRIDFMTLKAYNLRKHGFEDADELLRLIYALSISPLVNGGAENVLHCGLPTPALAKVFLDLCEKRCALFNLVCLETDELTRLTEWHAEHRGISRKEQPREHWNLQQRLYATVRMNKSKFKRDHFQEWFRLREQRLKIWYVLQITAFTCANMQERDTKRLQSILNSKTTMDPPMWSEIAIPLPETRRNERWVEAMWTSGDEDWDVPDNEFYNGATDLAWSNDTWASNLSDPKFFDMFIDEYTHAEIAEMGQSRKFCLCSTCIDEELGWETHQDQEDIDRTLHYDL